MPKINPENEARRQRRKELSSMLDGLGVKDVNGGFFKICAKSLNILCFTLVSSS
ncbi:MAG: hypothetical protein FWC75_07450 [Oscillospiraceae bacterium]|nr:hypothetical protein [Oscillospiraceae bacterium]